MKASADRTRGLGRFGIWSGELTFAGLEADRRYGTPNITCV